jgi:hypothetical protein
MKSLLYTSASSAIVFVALSAVVFAQQQGQQALTAFSTIGKLISSFNANIVQTLGVLAISSAVVVFFFGIVQYIFGIRNGDAAKAKAGNLFMVWGLVGLFVMFSVWGIIYFAQSIFGIVGINASHVMGGQAPQSNSSSLSPLDGFNVNSSGAVTIPASTGRTSVGGMDGFQVPSNSGGASSGAGAVDVPSSAGGSASGFKTIDCSQVAEGTVCSADGKSSCQMTEQGIAQCSRIPTINFTPPPPSPVTVKPDPPANTSPGAVADAQGAGAVTTQTYQFTISGLPLSASDGASSCDGGFAGMECGTSMRCAYQRNPEFSSSNPGAPLNVLKCFKAVSR